MCDKNEKILYGTSVNKPDDTTHNEISSYWNDEKIQRMSSDVQFSNVEIWVRGNLLSYSTMQNFSFRGLE
jgi:hypothetical protein